jgi:hypothetical protein
VSDFDDVLERLLNDPPFASALADDPDVALAGYRLDDSEIALLRSQVVGDTAGDVAKVETRTNKSSTFGLLAPFAALGGLAESVGHSLATGADVTTHTGLGDAAPGGAWGSGGGAGFTETPGGAWGAGGGAAASVSHEAIPDLPGGAWGSGGDGYEVPGGAWGSGGGAYEVPGGAWGAGGGAGVPAHEAFGDAPAVHEGLGTAPHEALGNAPTGHAAPHETALPRGYHPRVDVDGDGHWDHATYRSDGHGGAEIVVDRNHDGQADFIGHDANLDGKVDYADYDTDHDGVMDKRMYDDNGDGWLDRTVRKDSGS